MPTGMRTTYSDTNIRARVVADMVSMIDFESAPLLRLLGVQNQGKFRFKTWPTTKPEWLEDNMAPLTSTLASGYSTTQTTLTVASNTGVYFRKNQILEIDSERFLVTSVSSDTVTVVYAYQGTTNASHSSGATVTIVSVAAPEGDDPVTGYTTQLTNPYNYTQILSETVKVSRTAQKNAAYGVQDQMAYQMGKLFSDSGKAGLLAQTLARTFYKGTRYEDTTRNIRTMGGFDQFVTTNAAALAGVPLQRKDIEDKIESIVNYGAQPDLIVCGSWAKRKITSFFEGSIKTERDESVGGAMIETIQTDFGKHKVVFDWMSPRADVRIVSSAKCGWVEFDPFGLQELAKVGDYDQAQVVGEYSFVLMNEKAHAKITGASTTA